MSSGGQIVGGIVGAVVGFYVGGPVGAFQGAALGAGIGGYLDPPKGPTVQGPRLSDLSVQISTYGAFIPRVYGTVGLSGNLLWLENNRLKEQRTEEEEGGKGGGSTSTVVTFTYSATFAISLADHEIDGIRRIWCADKLIYNAGANDIDSIIASNESAKGWRLYRGTDDQMPDSRYEADVGSGNAPAYRGTAYIVFYDFQLADYGNTLQAANFKFEIVRDATIPSWRYLLRVDSGIQYLANFVSPTVGRPYIHEVDGPAFFVSAGGSAYFHGSNGVGRYDGPSNMGLPDTTGSGTSRVFSFARNSSGKILKFTGFDRVFFPTDIRVTDTTFGDTLANIAPDFPAAYTMKLTGLTCNLAGSRFLATFSDASFSASADRIDAWCVFEDDGSVLFSGGALPSLSSALVAGMGRMTQDVHFNYAATSLSEDGSMVFCADGARTRDFKIFDLSNGFSLVLDISQAFSLAGQFSRPSIAERNGVVYVVAGKYCWQWTSQGGLVINPQTLSSIIQQEITLTGLVSAADIDVSAIDDVVQGYRVLGGTIRAALEPLQGAYPFDVIPSGYKIKAVPRGQASVATIPWQDLGATSSESVDSLLKQSREMDSQLPVKLNIKYLDQSREYNLSEQHAGRLNTAAANREDREYPLVLTADQAAGVAEVLLYLAWLERTDFNLTLPPAYQRLEASDVVTVVTEQASYELRLVEVQYGQDGTLSCSAKANRAALYTPAALGSEAPGPEQPIPSSGKSFWLALDIPVVDETRQNMPGFASIMSGYSQTWPGGVLFRSIDSGQTWQSLQGFSPSPSFGLAMGVLGASTGTLVDQRSLTIATASGEFFGITKEQMFAGRNYAAYGVDGRWEIVLFQNATLNADGSYTLSGFIRGQRGTEWATGLHQAGDYFVLLDDSDNEFIGQPHELIASPVLYRAVTLGRPIESAASQGFTYNGVNLECLGPVSARGVRDGSSNFSCVFTRRSRLSSNWWVTGVPAPVGEVSEAYEIDVMSGSTVKRTISSSTSSFNYSAADQVTDFGSVQSAIAFRLYQISGAVGRGYPLEVTL